MISGSVALRWLIMGGTDTKPHALSRIPWSAWPDITDTEHHSSERLYFAYSPLTEYY